MTDKIIAMKMTKKEQNAALELVGSFQDGFDSYDTVENVGEETLKSLKCVDRTALKEFVIDQLRLEWEQSVRTSVDEVFDYFEKNYEDYEEE